MMGPRKGHDVVPDTPVTAVPFEEEPFLTGFDMAGQGAIGEPESSDRSGLVDDVHNAAGIEPPHSQHMPQHGHDLARFQWGLAGTGLDPAQLELLPTLQGSFRGQKHQFTVSQSDAGVIDGVTDRRRVCCGPTAG